MKHVCMIVCTMARRALPMNATSMPETAETGTSQGKYPGGNSHAFAYQDVQTLACG
jgi:hypothetical protein